MIFYPQFLGFFSKFIHFKMTFIFNFRVSTTKIRNLPPYDLISIVIFGAIFTNNDHNSNILPQLRRFAYITHSPLYELHLTVLGPTSPRSRIIPHKHYYNSHILSPVPLICS